MMETAPEAATIPDEEPNTVRGCRLKGHILVVDDVNDIQRLFAMLLNKAGAKVSFAENGQVAYEKAMAAWESGHPFDLILMDIYMPVLDGYTATRRLRDAGYRGRIIAHTATDPAVNSREKCLQAGCDDYMTKPFSRRKLLQLVSNHLPGR